ncbi:hypothetical protein NMG60_11023017 [Bertholletia excelsa]
MFKLFGGKDPFDDPFFTSPFDMFQKQTDSGHRSKEITIEEVDSDGNPLSHSEPNKELVVKDPSGKVPNKNPNGGGSNLSFQRVSYGGLNGMYYTTSVTRKKGDDGVLLMEINEEDKTVGESLSTVSRGIQDRGLSVSTKRTSDGKPDTVQTLHNLNEDELVNFEEAWNANAQKLPAEWDGGFKLLEDAEAKTGGWDWWPAWDGWALPWTEQAGGDGGAANGRAKKTVQIDME